MSQKYYVTLSEDERKELKKIIKEGKTQGYKIKHAQILLAYKLFRFLCIKKYCQCEAVKRNHAKSIGIMFNG
ncbi:MAG: hypothetical protein ABFD79_00910 [Phycisphaerales bacterium]